MFHAFHYLTMDSGAASSKNKKEIDSIVKESLASYFEYQFASMNFRSHDVFHSGYDYESKREIYKSYGQAMAEHTQKSWNLDMFIYPYSGAKYIKQQGDLNHNEALFRMVYEKSINSMKSAFDLLSLFYELEID